MPAPKPPTMPSKPPTTPASPAPTAAKPKLPATLPGKPSPKSARVPKVFKIADWTSSNEGDKVTVYSPSGGGKTTLASMIEGAVFLGLDDGGRKIVNPKTGKMLAVVPGVESFEDVRDALHQGNLWPDGCTIVIDTMTKLEELSEAWILENYRTKSGKATHMRQFGWDASSHYLDACRLILSDLEPHVRAGKNVVLLCQLGQGNVSNAGGADYKQDGPRLHHTKDYSCRDAVCEWSDYVFRINYNGLKVNVAEGKTVGKVADEELDRAIFTSGATHFLAKSRPTRFGTDLPPVVDFSAKDRDDIWQILFHGAQVS